MIDYNDKKIAIYGFGREGKAALNFLKEKGYKSTINIINDLPLDKEEILKIYHDINFYFENNISQGLLASDIVIKSPGISLYKKEIIKAKEKGTEFTSPFNLWHEAIKIANPTVKIIGITGTKGKSTTSSLINTILCGLGYNSILVGNIGIPALEMIKECKNADFIVAEFSSYQASDVNFSPDIGVLLNLFPEHIDWHLTHDNYYQDKMHLFANRIKGQKLIINPNDALSNKSLSDVLYFENKYGLTLKDIALRGEHNLLNISASLKVIEELGLDIEKAKDIAKKFKGLEHRLQILGIKNNITFVNDSISTTPETAISAIKSFNDYDNITLIAGGYDRKQDYKILADFINHSNVDTVITINQTGKIIADILRDNTQNINIIQSTNLYLAFDLACNNVKENGVILFSPASPSYDSYKNFIERGEHFIKLFEEL